MSFIIIDDNLYKIEGSDQKLLSMGNKFLESRFDDTNKVKIKSKFKKLKKIEKLNHILLYTEKLGESYG